jgi:hypothetical protein
MSSPAYSSLEAFVAHYHLLRAAHAPAATLATPASPANPSDAATLATPASPSDAATLAEMELLVAGLGPAERTALTDDAPATGAVLRHRARAELHLRRLLAARGLLAG